MNVKEIESLRERFRQAYTMHLLRVYALNARGYHYTPSEILKQWSELLNKYDKSELEYLVRAANRRNENLLKDMQQLFT